MTAKQDFNGPVSTAIQADVVHLNRNDRGRLLTRDERREVNARVQKLAEDFGNPPWETWRLIHKAIGAESVEEITIEHRDQIDIILNLLVERGELIAKADSVASEVPALDAANDSAENAGCPMCRARGGGIKQLVALYPRQFALIGILGICVGAMFR